MIFMPSSDKERKKYDFDPLVRQSDLIKILRDKHQYAQVRGGHYWTYHQYYTYRTVQRFNTSVVSCKCVTPNWSGGGETYELMFIPEELVALAEEYVRVLYNTEHLNADIYGHDVHMFVWWQNYRTFQERMAGHFLSGRYAPLEPYVKETKKFTEIVDYNRSLAERGGYKDLRGPIKFLPRSLYPDRPYTYDDSLFTNYTIVKASGYILQERGRYRYSWYLYHFDEALLYQAFEVQAPDILLDEWREQGSIGNLVKYFDDNIPQLLEQIISSTKIKTIFDIDVCVNERKISFLV